MKYTCTECRYIYDEAFGDTAENIQAGKSLYDIWETFSCPGCWSSIDSFQEIQEEVLRAHSLDSLSMIESEHIPRIHFLENKPGMIEVLVWEPPHSMFEEHYIWSISLYDEDWDMIEEINLSYDDDPVAKFDVSDLDFFSVQAKCNQHGIWSSRDIKNQQQ